MEDPIVDLESDCGAVWSAIWPRWWRVPKLGADLSNEGADEALGFNLVLLLVPCWFPLRVIRTPCLASRLRLCSPIPPSTGAHPSGRFDLHE